MILTLLVVLVAIAATVMILGVGAYPGNQSTQGGVSLSTPVMGVRQDRAIGEYFDTQFGVNTNRLVRLQTDSGSNVRVTAEGAKASYRTTANFNSDSTGTDVWYLQGSGAVDLQTINTGSATAGTWTAAFTSGDGVTYTTGIGGVSFVLPWNATAQILQRALELLPNIGKGNVLCTGGPLPATAIKVFFIGALAGYQYPLVLNTSAITGTWSSPITHTTLGFANQHALTATGGSANGLFTLSFTHPGTGQVVTTAGIAYNATTAAVVLAINAALVNLTGNGNGTAASSTSIAGGAFCFATPNGPGTNGALQTNQATFSFAGILNGYNFNSDMLLMTYDEGGNPGASFSTFQNTNARVQKLRKLTVTLVATAAGTGLIQLKRAVVPVVSTTPFVPFAPAGATLATTNLKNGILDALDPSPSYTCKYYTVHPTAVVTATDVIVNEEIGSQAIGTYPVTKTEWNFEGMFGNKLPRLQGNSDIFVLNAAAALTGSGNIITVEAEVTEEPFTA